MEHAVEAYLRRVPANRLQDFLKACLNGEFKGDFSDMIEIVRKELERRKSHVRF